MVRQALSRTLQTQDYEILEAGSSVEAFEILQRTRPDLVLLDVNGSDAERLGHCREIRRLTQAPLIVFGRRGGQRDKVAAFDTGADEYIVKPVGTDELLARVRAILRRCSPYCAPPPFADGDLTIDCEYRKLLVRGHNVYLSPKEFEVLRHLLARQGKPVPHAELIEAVWGPKFRRGTQGNLHVVIDHLRRKIESDRAHPRYILTEPRFGYRFQPSPGGSERREAQTAEPWGETEDRLARSA
jgi:two-component system KDP operon response regulator KdpE